MLDTTTPTTPLSELSRGDVRTVVTLSADGSLEHRLLDMGFVEGAEVELLHLAPITQDPIAVRVDRAIVAMRRAEASSVMVSAGGA